MALVDIPGGELWPHPSSAANQALGTSTYTLDAADEKASAVFQAPKAGSIDTLKFRTGTVTTGATVTVGLYSLDTNGDPDIATGALGTTTLVVAATDDDKWLSVTLGTPVTVTEGQILSMVVSQPSTTPGSMLVATTAANRDGGWAGEFPYGDQYTTVWAKNGAVRPIMSIGYTSSGGTYPCWVRGPFFPGDGANLIAVQYYDSGSAPQEYGNIVIPNRKIRVCGMWAYLSKEVATSDLYFKLYSSPAGTPVAECATPLIDGAFSSNTSGGIHLWRFTSKLVLNAGTKYAFTALPTTVSNIMLFKTVANATTDMANIEGGSDMYGCSRNSGGGAFTELTTTRYVMGLWIDQGDDGAGGGGIVSQSRIIQNIGTY